ncbi:MAG: hypothetical protein Q8R98_03660 [Rubrivivax sp.]|nr:hypothetical protein [Rubrivivax sp.]MDP3610924.1 hypothetical protein [Rubrivivax sp.]
MSDAMPHGVPVVHVQPPTKLWWKSRTLWLNVLVLVLAAAETQLNVLQPLLPVNVYGLVAFGLPLLNVLLRAVTAARLTLTQPPTEPKGQ